MQIFHSLADIPADYGPTVVSIGNFDGVHRGHQILLAGINRAAQQLSAKSVAVTFDPHPTRVLRPDDAPRLISPMPQRLELLAQTGVDTILVLPFTAGLAQMSGHSFVGEILSDALHAAEVHEGDNFRFGYRAQSGAQELISLGARFGFRVIIHPPLSVRGMTVSSSEVRERIQSGDMTAARALLGRPFGIRSTPARGRGVGSKLTVPTINLAPYYELLPANGVYVTQVKIAGEQFDSVTNAGNRPTFGEDSYTVEFYLLNFSPLDLSADTPIELSFIYRIREERKFESPEALKAQILRDVDFAQRYFRHCRAIGSNAPSVQQNAVSSVP